MEKKAVLASWISDARAVESAPSLRRLDSGAVVEVDAILRALVLLDESTGRLRTEAAIGLAQDDIERNRFALGEGITGNVVATSAPE